MNIPLERLPTPCWVIDRGLLRKNVAVLDAVQRRSGAKIILALKGFAQFSVFDDLRKVLYGTTASSLNEARLGHEEFGREVHVYAPAYKSEELTKLIEIADHISFNSLSEWHRHRAAVMRAPRRVACGLRINPEYAEVEVDLYNPCREGSRFGVLASELRMEDIDGISGLHFHTLCEQNADVLQRTLEHVEQKFGPFLHGMSWLNMGGGHHISRPDYDLDLLCREAARIAEVYKLQVILEPGEAVALNTGYLVASVLDIIERSSPIVILDVSASAHMPDVLEMPYRPNIIGGANPGDKAWTCTLGGLTCLAGDVIGDWSFDRPLKVGDRLVFSDMAHYTMVKTTTFNGIPLPSIAWYEPDTDEVRVVRDFGYEDYRGRLS